MTQKDCYPAEGDNQCGIDPVTQKWCYPPNGRQHEQSNKNGSAANLRRRYAHARQAYQSKLIDQLVELFGLHRKSAIRAFANWLERTLSYLQLPSQWHRCLRTTNYLERLFRELRQRTELIGSFEQPAIWSKCFWLLFYKAN